MYVTPRNLIVTIGQSLNSAPDASGPNSLYGRMGATFAGRAFTAKGHIPGIAWLQWAQPTWAAFYDYWWTKAERVVYAMNGGETDLGQLANRTGAQIYADMVTVSSHLRGLSGRVRMAGATIQPTNQIGVATTTTGVQDVSTFAGSGTLNVASTTSPYPAITSGVRTLNVQTDAGGATVAYTATTGTSFTGCTTTAGSGNTSNGGFCRQTAEQARLDANGLIMADASSAFDQIIDYATGTNLTDPNNVTYYSDGLHPTAAGAAAMMAVAAPKVAALLLPS